MVVMVRWRVGIGRSGSEHVVVVRIVRGGCCVDRIGYGIISRSGGGYRTEYVILMWQQSMSSLRLLLWSSLFCDAGYTNHTIATLSIGPRPQLPP